MQFLNIAVLVLHVDALMFGIVGSLSGKHSCI